MKTSELWQFKPVNKSNVGQLFHANPELENDVFWHFRKEFGELKLIEFWVEDEITRITGSDRSS